MKKFLKHLWDLICNLFGHIAPALKLAIHWAVVITDAVKTFDENNPLVGDIITSLIPSQIDDKIKDRLRIAIPQILIDLKLVDATLSAQGEAAILKAAAAALKGLDENIKSAFLHSFSILVAQKIADDGALTWKDAVYLLQWYYDNHKLSTVPVTPPAIVTDTTPAPDTITQ